MTVEVGVDHNKVLCRYHNDLYVFDLDQFKVKISSLCRVNLYICVHVYTHTHTHMFN